MSKKEIEIIQENVVFWNHELEKKDLSLRDFQFFTRMRNSALEELTKHVKKHNAKNKKFSSMYAYEQQLINIAG